MQPFHIVDVKVNSKHLFFVFSEFHCFYVRVRVRAFGVWQKINCKLFIIYAVFFALQADFQKKLKKAEKYFSEQRQGKHKSRNVVKSFHKSPLERFSQKPDQNAENLESLKFDG